MKGCAGPLSLWGYDAQALAGDPNPGQTLAQVVDRSTGVSAHLASILRNQIATTNGINGRDMLATGAVPSYGMWTSLLICMSFKLFEF